MARSLLILTLLLSPLTATADSGSAAPVCKGSHGYADAWKYRRAAEVLAEYNPTSQIHLTIARP